MTEEDLIKLACHEQGGRKGCPKQAEYMVVLNKADTKERRDRACKIAKCLYENQECICDLLYAAINIAERVQRSILTVNKLENNGEL